MTKDNGKIALVTGAGSGIGRATSIALLNEGYRVVLAGRRLDALKHTAAGTEADRTLIVPTDLSDVASVQSLFAKTKEAFGRLDLLFNNAGSGAPPIPLEDLTLEQWRKVIDVNLTGAFLCTQAAFRLMKDQMPRGGRIINNGSISAHAPRPNSAPYTASKHAITGLTRSTSLDGRKYDIACGQIDIGNAATEMTARMKDGVPQAHGGVTVEPTMDVDNVARAVVYMASLPLDANVLFLTVMATKMPLVGGEDSAMAAGYSGTPLAKKLGIKSGFRVFVENVPGNYQELVAPLPEDVHFLDEIENDLDMIHLFADQAKVLAGKLKRYQKKLKRNGILWVSWPKKASKRPTDITEDTIRELALPLGLVDVKVCAVDDVWSGLKLVIRVENR